METAYINIKSLLLFVYTPILVSILFGLLSIYTNWDQKHLAGLFALWPSIAISSIALLWVLKNPEIKFRKKFSALLTGIIYLILFYVFIIYEKSADVITNTLIVTYLGGLLTALIALFFKSKIQSQIVALIYNLQLTLLIATALMGYLLIFVALAKVIYYTFGL